MSIYCPTFSICPMTSNKVCLDKTLLIYNIICFAINFNPDHGKALGEVILKANRPNLNKYSLITKNIQAQKHTALSDLNFGLAISALYLKKCNFNT